MNSPDLRITSRRRMGSKRMPRSHLIAALVLLIASVWQGNARAAYSTEATEAFDRGVAHFNRQEFDKAIDAFTTAIEMEPEYIEAYEYRALVYRRLDDLDQHYRDAETAADLRLRREFAEEVAPRVWLDTFLQVFLPVLLIFAWLIIRRANIITDYLRGVTSPEGRETRICLHCGRENSIHTRRCPRCENLLGS